MTILMRVLVTFFFISAPVLITGCSSLPESPLDKLNLGGITTNSEQGDKPIDARAELLVTSFQIALRAFITMELNTARALEDEKAINKWDSARTALLEVKPDSKTFFDIAQNALKDGGKQNMSKLKLTIDTLNSRRKESFSDALGNFLVGNFYGGSAGKGAQELFRYIAKNPQAGRELKGKGDTLSILESGAEFALNDMKSLVKYGKTMVDMWIQGGLKPPSLEEAKAKMVKNTNDSKEIALLAREEDPNF